MSEAFSLETLKLDADVLCVDDESDVLEAMGRSLREAGLKVVTCSSAEAGLVALDTQRVAVVLSDFRMPGLDGVAFLSLVRERWPYVERILVTAFADEVALERGINEANIVRFVRKPWHPDMLVAVVKQTLRSFQLRYEHAALSELVHRRDEDLARARVDKMAAIGRLASAVAHEINNPLHGILTFVQLAQRADVPADKLQRYHTLIHECALRCRDIVQSLREFSRDPSFLQKRPVGAPELFSKALVLFEGQEKVVLTHADTSGHAVCLGNANQLAQVLVNLVQNAIDATPPGGKVCISATATSSELALRVDDSGTGVPATLTEKIFEPYFTTKPEGVGTGLGLSVSFSIVSEHGGTLRLVEPSLGGASFEMRLPVHKT